MNRAVNHKSISWAVLVAITAAALVAGFLAGHAVRAAAATLQSPAPVESAAAPQQSYADVVDRAAPAVVTIRSARRVSSSGTDFAIPLGKTALWWNAHSVPV